MHVNYLSISTCQQKALHIFSE
ncbi:hypothethical protein (plasmid) [Ralstonia solanacearum CMR15]|nr:hypothethical protein [Ralstonia solanacearum CMR15]